MGGGNGKSFVILSSILSGSCISKATVVAFSEYCILHINRKAVAGNITKVSVSNLRNSSNGPVGRVTAAAVRARYGGVRHDH